MPHFRLRVLKVTTTTGRRNHLAKVRGENSQSRATFGEDQGLTENSKDKQTSCGFLVVNAGYCICWDKFFLLDGVTCWDVAKGGGMTAIDASVE